VHVKKSEKASKCLDIIHLLNNLESESSLYILHCCEIISLEQGTFI